MTDFITLSKWLPKLLYPLNLTICLLTLGLVLIMLRRQRLAVMSFFLATVVLAVSSSSLSFELYRQHEQQFPPIPVKSSPKAGAVVLLGGDVSVPVRPRLESELYGNRTLHAFRLYQAGKAKLIVISGGNVFPQGQNIKPEAYYTAGILNDWGIPDEAIVIETLSRNTHENAVQTSRLLQQRDISSILLVTSAVHMPRAYLCFEQAGLQVTPSPSGYSAASYDRPTIVALLPEVNNLQRTHQLIKEKLGIAVYRFRGWIN